ncbi:cohesin domain-containing protein, partial [Patescibacteria group bacterium]|nr:cohesin domain-containing protein [Patescibacteria group bacterium]
MFNLEKEFKSFLLLLKSKKALSLIGFGLLVLGLIAGLILIRYPQILQKKAAFDEPTLYFSPTNVSFDVGQEEMVEIYLYSGDESISGVDLTLEYESSDLEITKIEPGPYLTESVLDNPEIDNAVGMARFVYVNTSDNLPSGEFAIARVFVKGKRVVDQTRLLFTSNYEISRESLTQTNNLIIPSISLAGGIYNFISSVVSDGVVIAMIPQEDEVSFGQEFNIAVEVRAGSLNIDGVASHINFDHNLLRVVSIESGTTLPTILMNNFNNQSGSINYVAGILGNTVSGTFTLATITFEPIQQVFSTNLVFETNNPRKTDSTFEGYSVLGNLAGAVIATTLSPDSATVSFNISFQGINNVTDPKPEKQAKVTLKQGDEVIEVFEEVSLTANDNGSYTGR